MIFDDNSKIIFVNRSDSNEHPQKTFVVGAH